MEHDGDNCCAFGEDIGPEKETSMVAFEAESGEDFIDANKAKGKVSNIAGVKSELVEIESQTKNVKHELSTIECTDAVEIAVPIFAYPEWATPQDIANNNYMKESDDEDVAVNNSFGDKSPTLALQSQGIKNILIQNVPQELLISKEAGTSECFTVSSSHASLAQLVEKELTQHDPMSSSEKVHHATSELSNPSLVSIEENKPESKEMLPLLYKVETLYPVESSGYLDDENKAGILCSPRLYNPLARSRCAQESDLSNSNEFQKCSVTSTPGIFGEYPKSDIYKPYSEASNSHDNAGSTSTFERGLRRVSRGLRNFLSCTAKPSRSPKPPKRQDSLELARMGYSKSNEVGNNKNLAIKLFYK